jgi:hypothetical protein
VGIKKNAGGERRDSRLPHLPVPDGNKWQTPAFHFGVFYALPQGTHVPRPQLVPSAGAVSMTTAQCRTAPR